MEPKPRIFQSVQDLNSGRSSQVKELVHKIANKGRQVTPNSISIGARAYVIGVTDSPRPGNNYTEWRFNTYLKGFSAMYYERWAPYQRDLYFLERVYFHLFQKDPEELKEVEYILLHCDASEPEGSHHGIYKQSPHVHVAKSEQPLPHFHIALNNGNLADTLESLDSLTSAIDQAIVMIDHQILMPAAKKEIDL